MATPFRERFGFQIGRNSTDIVMLFMNDQALQRLLSDRFKTVADATAVAGLDGRHVAVGTDIKLSALV